MAVRRFDANVGDFITLSIGDLGTFHEGAFTVAALVKKETDGGFLPMVSAETAADSSRRSLWTTSADLLMSNTGGFNINTAVTFTQADGWAVVAVTKGTGEVLTRGHKGVLGGAWTHDDGDQGFDEAPGTQTLTNVKLGSWQDGAHWHGLIAVVAMWSGTALADEIFEAGFTTGVGAWLAAEPTAMWLLNQDDTATEVEDLVGDADQTAIDGTSVEDDDDPPGFSFDAGEELAGSGAALGAGFGAAAPGKVASSAAFGSGGMSGFSAPGKVGTGAAAAATTTTAHALSAKNAPGTGGASGGSQASAVSARTALGRGAAPGSSYAEAEASRDAQPVGAAWLGAMSAAGVAGVRVTRGFGAVTVAGAGRTARTAAASAVGAVGAYARDTPTVEVVPGILTAGSRRPVLTPGSIRPLLTPGGLPDGL